MKNLIKSLLLLSTLVTGIVQTAMGVNASAEYTRYTREFLGHLGHNNPAAVPVNKMMPNDRFYKAGAAGYAGVEGIHINEDLLARLNLSQGSKLFTCAHEATHFALGHAYQVRRNVLEIEKEADVEAGRMLCRCGYRWILEEHVAHLRRLCQAGRGGFTDGGHPTMQQQYNYLSQVLAAHPGNQGDAAVPARNQARNQNPKPANRAPVRNQVKAKPARVAVQRSNANKARVVRRGNVGNKALRQAQARKIAAQRFQARRR